MDPERLRRLVAEELARALAGDAPAGPPSAAPGSPTAASRTGLVVFSGLTIPPPALLSRLETLVREGWSLQALASFTFRERVLEAHPNALGRLPAAANPGSEAAVDRLARQSRLIIFPDLSDNALAKATLGIADSIPTRVLAAALSSGRACVLLESVEAPSPVVGLSRLERLRQLERRDAVLATLDDFPDRLRAALSPHVPGSFAPLPGGSVSTARPAGRAVLTADDVLAAARRGQSVLRIPRNAIVTDRAREEASRRGVQLLPDEAAP